VGDIELTDRELAALREFRHTAEHPAYAANGARAADHLRKLYPSLADIEMAAILCQVTGWAARHGAHCDCNHLFAFSRLLGATAADLAALELGAPPGPEPS
jgi:hypothetical protein